MTVLDDVGKTVKIWIEPEQQYGQVDVIMVVVAPNGDYCRIFVQERDNRGYCEKQWDICANVVHAFMENHV